MAPSVTLDGLRVTGRLAGDTEVVKLTMPEKPLMLVRLRANVTEEPAVIVTLLGFVDRTKLGVVMVENMADSIASGTALGEPLATVTQTDGSLVGAVGEPQPVWKPRVVPDVVLVML